MLSYALCECILERKAINHRTFRIHESLIRLHRRRGSLWQVSIAWSTDPHDLHRNHHHLARRLQSDSSIKTVERQ